MLELGTERLRRDLRRDADISRERIGSDKLYLVNPDGAVVVAEAQSFFNLLRDILSLRTADRERAHQAREIFDGNVFGKMQASQPGRVQQIREAALRIAGFQWNSVEQ